MPTMNDLLPQVASRQPVERLAADQISRFQRHFKSQGIPVHLTGLAAQWPALQRWTPEYFLTRFGDREVKLDGRVYTITYRATDASGNSSTAMETVVVPHNQ